ncbi:MAG: hypoxanthine phosphoribosyltransferase [Selenomonadaceae bacterium]|nr:hypoxanthine phosphoribosyltransferase [Selenomonadaceae bacterium]
MNDFEKDVERILITEEEIRARVQEIGNVISKDYNEDNDVVAIGILKGASIFFADLVRAIKIPLIFDFMIVSSYGDSSISSGEVDIKKELEFDVHGKDVILIEDIIDTGITMSCVRKIMAGRGANSVKLAAFLDKPTRRKVDLHIDYLGFTTPDEFLVGYGLDYAEKYRNLPYVGILKREIYE